MSNKKCEVEGCERKSIAHGVCYTHYRIKFGKPYVPETHRKKKEKDIKTIQPTLEVKSQEKTAKLPIIEHIAPASGTNILLDFQGYDDILAALKETSHNEMRTPEMQIMWILKQLLEKGKEAA